MDGDFKNEDPGDEFENEEDFDFSAIEEVSLSMGSKAKLWQDDLFILHITDCNGIELQFQIDGLQVGDIIADARDYGLPATWPFYDGVPRKADK
jgi:hypothetical protein